MRYTEKIKVVNVLCKVQMKIQGSELIIFDRMVHSSQVMHSVIVCSVINDDDDDDDVNDDEKMHLSASAALVTTDWYHFSF